jgi:hypothetical protein
MISHWMKLPIILCLIYSDSPLSECCYSADYQINFTVDQRLSTSGQREYSLRASFQRDDVENKLIAPDGTEFDYRHQYAERLTFPELASMAFGTWNAYTATSIAQFAFQQFTLNDVVSDIPFITSPVPGSEVPLKFDVIWQGEENGFVEILRRSNNIGKTGGVNPEGCCLYTINTELTDDQNGWLEIEAYTRTNLTAPTLLSNSSTTDTFSFFRNYFRSHSEPATYIVIPEPESAFLTAIGLMILGLRRRMAV